MGASTDETDRKWVKDLDRSIIDNHKDIHFIPTEDFLLVQAIIQGLRP